MNLLKKLIGKELDLIKFDEFNDFCGISFKDGTSISIETKFSISPVKKKSENKSNYIVVDAYEKINEYVKILFKNGSCIQMSLKEEDFNPEAIVLYFKDGKTVVWN